MKAATIDYSGVFAPESPARADEPVVEKFGWQFRARDKVIQKENNYDKDVFNGDIGQIVKIDPVERDVTIKFDRREVVYDFGELDEVAPVMTMVARINLLRRAARSRRQTALRPP